MDKIYQRKNLAVAWEKVKRNRGAGGMDGVDVAAFEADLEGHLERLHVELKEGTYAPQPVLQHLIPKAGKPGEFRALGIPTIDDRVCQQAMLNRLEPIFEPIFDDANFGYRSGRSTKDGGVESRPEKVGCRRMHAIHGLDPVIPAGMMGEWVLPGVLIIMADTRVDHSREVHQHTVRNEKRLSA